MRHTTAGTVRTRCVRDTPAPEDGQRVLITRLWSRGMTRARVAAAWDRRVAPSRERLMAYRSGGLSWTAYVGGGAAEP
ncbi:MAG: hypothetical protein EYC70_03065 [Planctomycetota bacterium]|nr:MAG: hypothetical protein EYC70_03065 [Planctomycetota bacterium]